MKYVSSSMTVVNLLNDCSLQLMSDTGWHSSDRCGSTRPSIVLNVIMAILKHYCTAVMCCTSKH